MSNVRASFEKYRVYREVLARNKGLPFKPVAAPNGFTVEEVHTEDAGTILVPMGDTEFPAFYDEVLNLSDNLAHTMRPEVRVIASRPSFEAHLQSLSQLKRSWKNTANLMFHPARGGEFDQFKAGLIHIIVSNLQHFNPGMTFEGATETAVAYLEYIAAWSLIPNSDVVLVFRPSEDGKFTPCGIGMFQMCPENDEYHWVNTLLLRDQYAKEYTVGNVMLLQALRLCYKANVLYLNLGLAVFDYKKTWKPIPFERKVPVLLDPTE